MIKQKKYLFKIKTFYSNQSLRATSREKTSQQTNTSHDLYLELLVVTDCSVFNDHKTYLQTNRTDLIFLHMSLYFYHFINGVNERFQNAFVNDSSINSLTIKLSNFLFLTVSILPAH